MKEVFITVVFLSYPIFVWAAFYWKRKARTVIIFENKDSDEKIVIDPSRLYPTMYFIDTDGEEERYLEAHFGEWGSEGPLLIEPAKPA